MASTTKRQRKKANAAARRAALEAARKKQQRKRQIGLVVAAVLGVVLVAALVTFLGRGGDDDTDVAAGGTTTTAVAEAPAGKQGSQDCPPAGGSAERRTTFDGHFKTCIDASKAYRAVMETDAGTIRIDLDAKKAPKTVNNFVSLARYRFYDGVAFHRVIPDFVVQGGDPKGDGSGGPGYRIEDELPQQGEYKDGSLAMANTSAPNTGGSQFFIINGAQGRGLPPQYSLFGQVTEGMDVVAKIQADGSPSGVPTKGHTITKVTIEES